MRRAKTPDMSTTATVEVPARDLREGMTVIAMPECDVTLRADGTYPPIVGAPRYLENGEGGHPSVYWDADLPCRCDVPVSERPRRERWALAWCRANICDRHYWAPADDLITVTAEN